MFWLSVSVPDTLFTVTPPPKVVVPEPDIVWPASPLNVTPIAGAQLVLFTKFPPILIAVAELTLKEILELFITRLPLMFNVPVPSVLVTGDAASKTKLP